MPSAETWELKVRVTARKESDLYTMINYLREYGTVTQVKIDKLFTFQIDRSS